jgi:hypothetical protein
VDSLLPPDEVIRHIESGKVEEISLDYDLG